MNAWVGVGAILVVIELTAVLVCWRAALCAPLAHEEPLVMSHDPTAAPPPPEPYERLVPRDLLVLALAMLLAACAPAAAQQAQKPCGPHDDIMGQLDQRYREEIRSLGLQSNGHVIQVYASATGATWTIVSTRPDGVACIVASGKWWQDLPRDVPIGMAR